MWRGDKNQKNVCSGWTVPDGTYLGLHAEVAVLWSSQGTSGNGSGLCSISSQLKVLSHSLVRCWGQYPLSLYLTVREPRIYCWLKCNYSRGVIVFCFHRCVEFKWCVFSMTGRLLWYCYFCICLSQYWYLAEALGSSIILLKVHSLVNPAIFKVLFMVLERHGNARGTDYWALNRNNNSYFFFLTLLCF